jgi:hypothetical protein
MFGSNRDFYHTGLQVGRSDIRSMLDGMGPGNQWFVDYEKGADGNDGQSWEKAFRTYSRAINAAVTNNNDVINIDGNSEVVETAMVTLSKNRVHTVGWNGALGHYGPGARIGMGVTTDTDDVALFKNTGVRNTFTGVKWNSSNTLTESRFTVWETGEYARYHNCEIQKLTHLADTNAADLKLTGDSPQFYNSMIGVSSLTTVGAVIRPNVMVLYISSSQRTRDGLFENCIFPKFCGNAAARMVYVNGATAVERWLIFKDCIFINSVLAAADPAEALSVSAAQTAGVVFLKNCSSVLCDLMIEASVGIFVDGAVPTHNTSGVSVTG